MRNIHTPRGIHAHKDVSGGSNRYCAYYAGTFRRWGVVYLAQWWKLQYARFHSTKLHSYSWT